MNLHIATHYGMCFGVRDALSTTYELLSLTPATVLGELVHNPVVQRQLRERQAAIGQLKDLRSATTEQVVITAHGASDRQKLRWQKAGHQITDTTCPLVHHAHQKLAQLVQDGFTPVVIGQAGHAEVEGLVGDYPDAIVILFSHEIYDLPLSGRWGIVAQTTQPIDYVEDLVQQLRALRPMVEIRFIDTVCRPTKQRQAALEELCQKCDTVIIVGGRSSNNTRQLTQKAERMGVRAYQIEHPDELCVEWLAGSENVGLTAGTSTLEETVQAVRLRLETLAQLQPNT
jgi:4-hydroxy-3-methylbut-2-en-1-yl diphosphate reductase